MKEEILDASFRSKESLVRTKGIRMAEIAVWMTCLLG